MVVVAHVRQMSPLVILSFLLVVLASCVTRSQAQTPPPFTLDPAVAFDDNGCVTDFKETDGCDYFLAKGAETGPGFTISYHKFFKVIHNELETSDEFPNGRQYVAYMCGTPQPEGERLEEAGVTDSDPIFVEIPIQAYGINYQQVLPFLQGLGRGEEEFVLYPSIGLLPACAPTGDFINAQCGFDPVCQEEQWVDSGAPVLFHDGFGPSTPDGSVDGGSICEYQSI